MIASAQQPDTRPAETQTTIAAPLGSNAWPDEFSQKVTWVSNQQNQVAELHLNPPDLGPMSVVLTVADNQASAVFSSPHSSVREAIENAMPKLRESLAENGIMLGNATVSDQAPRDNGSNNFTQHRSQTVNRKSEVSINAPAISAPVILRRHNGIVDTFA
jgi:flagellar hook-length control protein FliK